MWHPSPWKPIEKTNEVYEQSGCNLRGHCRDIADVCRSRASFSSNSSRPATTATSTTAPARRGQANRVLSTNIRWTPGKLPRWIPLLKTPSSSCHPPVSPPPPSFSPPWAELTWKITPAQDNVIPLEKIKSCNHWPVSPRGWKRQSVISSGLR